ncbi:phosphatidylcholine desaturase [uncultured Synechococcales cyanobacterium]|uniref:Phosphatidylcholine desaturase n=1 Tax=uncultured Synechococcales cyanobacterium TaxID=1936017 RepID=A0A6J4VHW4_9CYAN|nr:phosphatidylcholine desaturase [uncultured Synechococcales cyanobacterium]
MSVMLTPQTTSPLKVGSNIQLKDILKTLPRECFQKNRYKAWASVTFSVVMVSLSYGAIALAPWFLLPFAWFFAGTALTGFFVLAHDCGHRSFAQRRWVNDLVGHLLMLPLLYPFHSWRLLHNQHHTHTNKLELDNAWEPYEPEFYASLPKLVQRGYQVFRGPLWWLASVIHWAGLHFDLSQFQPKDRQKVKLSIAAVAIFAAIAFPLLIATTGIWGLVKFWLLPWLAYHFWLSTFTLVHHTAPDIPFHKANEWNAVQAQLSGTVHCDYPRWIESLCHDINVHIPHHISTAIPSYNLRIAYASLQQNWSPYLYECRFSWPLLQKITRQCNLHNPADNCYQTFREFHTGR